MASHEPQKITTIINYRRSNCIKNAMTYLSTLQTQQRHNETKLIQKIISNILSSPNTLRYQSLNISALTRKCISFQIWHDLLLSAGFDKSKDKRTLTFDTTKLNQLKSVHSELSKQEFMIFSGKSKQQKISKTSKAMVKCICGANMKILTSTNTNIFCFVCKAYSDSNIKFWHCDQQISCHPWKYNLCELCINSGCIGNIVKCCNLNRLILDMSKSDGNASERNSTRVVNDYLHLMNSHNNDMDFAYIVDKIGVCDILKCQRFQRNTRDRTKINCNSNYKQANESEISDAVHEEIVDKVHCYFAHSYDIGNRLSVVEKQIVNNHDGLSVAERNCNDCNDYLVNQLILEMHKILRRKRDNINQQRFYQRMKQKFTQITAENDTDEKDDEDTKEDMYSYGYNFHYGYKSEQHFPDSIHIHEKYDSLKKEITSNEIFVTPMKCFNKELRKAMIHFESKFCKREFRPFADSKIDIDPSCLLAIMIYCNFDKLQNAFSKTYRISDHEQHREFYHLAKYLKMAVHTFGDYIEIRYVTRFYHGLNNKFKFPDYISEVEIYCPLSTSSSFEVAANFANYDNADNGLIVEFGSTGEQFNGSVISPRYFSVSWLSNYASESEYLFLQMESFFSINNIIEITLGYEYDMILKALQNIDRILYSYHDDNTFSGNVAYSINKTIKLNISNKMHDVMEAIILDQLSSKMPSYSKFNSLNTYARQICETYFINKWSVEIDYFYCKSNSPFLCELLFQNKGDWISVNFRLLVMCFSKVNRILIKNVNLCSLFVKELINFLDSVCKTKDDIKTIWLSGHKKSELSVTEVVDQVIIENRVISANLYHDQLNIEQIDNEYFEFTEIGRLFQRFGQIYFKDVNGEKMKIFEALITNELAAVDASELFHSWCLEQELFELDWRELSKNIQNIGVFSQFYHYKQQWINLQSINKLLPNLTDVYVRHIRVSSFMLKNILEYLQNSETNITVIWIYLGDGKKSVFGHRDKAPNPNVIMHCLKEITGYNGNVYEHDWGSFDNLYKMLDEIEHGEMNENEKNEKVYYLNSLIVKYATLKYEEQFQSLGFYFFTNDDMDQDIITIQTMS
eukprot:58981_1